jgi:hypothetical protein
MFKTLYLAVIYKCFWQTEVFVSGRPFLSSLMSASKVGAYPNGATFGVLNPNITPNTLAYLKPYGVLHLSWLVNIKN